MSLYRGNDEPPSILPCEGLLLIVFMTFKSLKLCGLDAVSLNESFGRD